MKIAFRMARPFALSTISAFLLGLGLSMSLTGCSNPHSKLTAEQAVTEAMRQVSGLRFDNAYELFDVAAQKSTVGSELHLKAMFGKATCAHHRMPPNATNIAAAAELYNRVILEAPNGRYAARATLALGRIAELRDYNGDKVDLSRAREYYEKVIAGWPNDPIVSEATLRLGASYIQTFDESLVRRGIAILEKFLSQKPDDPLNSAMWQYLGDSYFSPLSLVVENENDRKIFYRKSLDAYQKAESIGWMQRGRQGPIYWRMAVMADRYLHDASLAAKYYTKIIVETPNSGKAYEAQLAIRRLNTENPTLNAPVPKINIFRNTEVIGQNHTDGDKTHG